jgi:hypothetical protein
VAVRDDLVEVVVKEIRTDKRVTGGNVKIKVRQRDSGDPDFPFGRVRLLKRSGYTLAPLGGNEDTVAASKQLWGHDGSAPSCPRGFPSLPQGGKRSARERSQNPSAAA